MGSTWRVVWLSVNDAGKGLGAAGVKDGSMRFSIQGGPNLAANDSLPHSSALLRLLPQLVSRASLVAGGAIGARPCVRLLADHLAVGLAYEDAPTRLLTADELRSVGVGFRQALAGALDRLARRSDRSLQGAQGGLMFSRWRDGFDAARLLLANRLNPSTWRGLRGKPVFLAADRDLLLVTGSEELDGLSQMAACARELTADEGGISSVPVWCVEGVWVPFLPAAAQVGHTAFKSLRLEELQRDYRRQGPQLVAAEDTFVADYSVMAADEEPFSYSVWTRGVRALLPQSEQVALVDPTMQTPPTICSFNSLRPFLTPLADGRIFPPRYATGDFGAALRQRTG